MMNQTATGSDNGLVGRAKAGERDAFDALAVKYRSQLLKLTRRYTTNEADAEDIVQDTLLRAFRGLQSYRGASNFYTWLYRIAENSAKSALIVRLRRTRCFSSLTHDNSAAGEVDSPQTVEWETPEAIAITHELQEALRAAFAAIPADQQRAIMLFQIEGLSYHEVAAAMKCPIGTVRSRVSRARDLLERRLEHIVPVDHIRVAHSYT